MNNTNKGNFLLEAPVKKLLIRFGIPLMIGMLITAVNNVVDAYFVSNLGMSQMAAISVVFPIGQFFVALGLLFGGGAGSYISRLLGKNMNEKANQVASTAVFLAVLSSIIISIILLVFQNNLFLLFKVSKTTLPFANSYARIFIAGSLLNVFDVCMTNIVASQGNPKVTMRANIVGMIVNIILDPLLIYTCDLRIEGAAIATVISQLVVCFIYIIHLASKKDRVILSIKNINFEHDIITEILKIGVPTMVFQLLISINTTLINYNATPFGDSAVAALGAVTRILSIGSLLVFGFTKGLQPIAGFSFGSKRKDRLNEAVNLSVKWTSTFCVIFALLAFLLSKQIITPFSGDDALSIKIGAEALRINAISFIFLGFYSTVSTLLLALGMAKSGGILGLCRQGFFFIPLILILPCFFKVTGIILAQPISDILAAALALYLLLQARKNIISKL